jgi:hypothetical protein
MPDATGRLTQADNETIKRWWDLHWKAPVTCPVCKTEEWTLGSHVLNFQRHAADATAPGSQTYPHIAVACKTCAHTMFFNAVNVGVAAAWAPPQSQGVVANPFSPGSLLNPSPPSNPFDPAHLNSLLRKDK